MLIKVNSFAWGRTNNWLFVLKKNSIESVVHNLATTLLGATDEAVPSGRHKSSASVQNF